jgi:hypothetical protein
MVLALFLLLSARAGPAGGSVMKPTLKMPARWQATTTRPTDS